MRKVGYPLTEFAENRTHSILHKPNEFTSIRCKSNLSRLPPGGKGKAGVNIPWGKEGPRHRLQGAPGPVMGQFVNKDSAQGG